MPMQTNDPRIAWCREFIPGFAEIHDAAERARADTEANREWARRELMSREKAARETI